jgi:hypothetical protein
MPSPIICQDYYRANSRSAILVGALEVGVKAQKSNINYKILIRNFVVEIIVYGVLVTLYFFLVLQYLSLPLKDLYNENLYMYAIIALLLIVLQAILLERLTSFLLDRIGLRRFE